MLAVPELWKAWQLCNALKLISHEIALVLAIKGTSNMSFKFSLDQ
jgi:hypothetical protein